MTCNITITIKHILRHKTHDLNLYNICNSIESITLMNSLLNEKNDIDYINNFHKTSSANH